MQGHGRCLKLFLAFALLLLQYAQGEEVDHSQRDTNATRRCIEKERQALLAFKRGLLVDEDHNLSSWGSEAQKQDYCRWIGVSCSNQTGHVIGLDLSYKAIGEDHYYLQGKMISPKLIELHHLQHLDLNGIYFSGSQFPNFIGSLTNLRYLDLSSTYFGGKFPSQVGNLTNLVYLDLSYNIFTNAENLNWLPPLLSLRYLDLSSVNLSNVFDWSKAVNKLPELTNLTLRYCDLPPPILSILSYINSSQSLASVDLSSNDLSTSSIFLWLSNYNASLVYLDLSFNQLVGSIPDVLGNMSSLAHLSLSYNQFEGGDPHSFARLCSLQTLFLLNNNLSGQLSKFVQILFSTCAQNSLEELYLSENNLAGSVPDLTKLSSLKILYLSFNQLSGGISKSIGLMSKLEYIDFRMNFLEGVISETHFSKLSKLRHLDLSSNNLVLDIHADWIPPFQLRSIYLRSCKMGPYFPKWLQTQKEFSSLDISDAGISDIFPSWFWSLCRNVTFMNLTSNQIRGTFANLTLEFSDFSTLLLSSNKLEGPIPLFLSTTKHLDLSNNKLSGSISFLCSSRAINLGFLDLSNNNVSGQVPDCLTHLESLVMLDLSNNALSGKIPSEITHLVGLVSLNLSRNQLTGQITPEIGNLQLLDSLDLSRNHIDGRIPTSLARIDRLGFLDLSYNNLSGKIPVGTQLQGFDPSFYAGNLQLYGPPLKTMCADEVEKGPSEQTDFINQEDKDELITLEFYISMELGFIAGFLGVWGTLIFSRSWRYAYFKFLNGLNDWLFVRIALLKRQLLKDA